MSRKTAARRRNGTAQELLAPTLERKQHGRVTLATETMLDDRGVISQPFRAETMLERLERAGNIGLEERLAGEEFQRWFRIAHLDPLQAADLMREIRVQGPHGLGGIEYARRRVNDAMQALGGHGSSAGKCAWFVLGNELTIADWARRETYQGRPTSPHSAKGILVATLGVLAPHFGR